MFMDGVDEFFKCFLEKINRVVTTDGKDMNVSGNKLAPQQTDLVLFQKTIDIQTLEKAYFSLTHTSLINLHNYFKNDIVNRNRGEIIKFMNTQQQYENLVEESENIQKM